jgi:hypothetical protein
MIGSAPGRPPIQVTATPCPLPARPTAQPPIASDVNGFALAWNGQAHGVLWITGATVLYDGVRQVADRLQVGTALLHLGCVRFPITGPVRYSMTAREAIQLCQLVRPRTAIPVHYEGWTHFHQDRPAIERELAQAPADISRSIRWLPIGEATTVAAPPPTGGGLQRRGARHCDHPAGRRVRSALR